MKIRVTVDFEVKDEDKFRTAAAIEESAKSMVGTMVAEGGKDGTFKLTFPTGAKGPRAAKPAGKPAGK